MHTIFRSVSKIHIQRLKMNAKAEMFLYTYL